MKKYSTKLLLSNHNEVSSNEFWDMFEGELGKAIISMRRSVVREVRDYLDKDKQPIVELSISITTDTKDEIHDLTGISLKMRKDRPPITTELIDDKIFGEVGERIN